MKIYFVDTEYFYDNFNIYNHYDNLEGSKAGYIGDCNFQYTIWDSPSLRITFIADATTVGTGFRLNISLGCFKYCVNHFLDPFDFSDWIT